MRTLKLACLGKTGRAAGGIVFRAAVATARAACLLVFAALAPGQEAASLSPAPAPNPNVFRDAWALAQQGQLSASARYRYEGYERDQPDYPHISRASTLRLALGYETPTLWGFSGFAEYEGVYILGVGDYSVPTDPRQRKPGYPAILDPPGSEANQAWARWKYAGTNLQATFTLGRQEIVINDGRFVSISPWRQNHQSFDAAAACFGLPADFAVNYYYLARVHRVVGPDAIDGQPPMNSHLFDLRWKRPDIVNVSAYGLFLDWDSPALYSQSTRTLGLRLAGPLQLSRDWAVHYVAEYAKQQDYGRNPYHVDANYWLGEAGLIFKKQTLKAGVAWLGGCSLTDKLSTPLANPFNGWTELFVSNPSLGSSHGLEAAFINANGPLGFLDGLSYVLTYYDYHAANDRLHYGSELDAALAYQVKPVWKKWEVGCRFARYWADQLFGDALRASVYTSIAL
jgi:hypothetical protein